MEDRQAGKRLNKFIADSGYCSRREADRLIEEGRVQVDGRTGVLGDKILPGIGTGADESQTDAATTAAEIEAAVQAGCRGAAFFTLNDSLLEILEAFR